MKEMKLTKGQKNVIESDSHAIAFGEPGCGKTTAALLKAKTWIERPLLEKDFQKVLFLSFSRAAVHRIRQAARIDATGGRLQQLRMDTFHAFFLDLLRSYWWKVGLPQRIEPLAPHVESVLKKKDSYVEDDFMRMEREEGKVRFSRFAPLCLDLLRNNPILLEALNLKYPLVIIDEYQDTSNSQDELMRYIGRGSQLLVLGDPDQRIYNYRADTDERRMEKTANLSAFTRIDLEPVNHRSGTSGILQFAQAVRDGDDLDQIDRPQSIGIWKCGVKPEHIYLQVNKALGSLWTEYKKVVPVTRRKDFSVALMVRTNGLAEALAEELVNDNRRFSLLVNSDQLSCAIQVVLSMLEAGTKEPVELASQILAHLRDFEVLRSRTGDSRRIQELTRWRSEIEAGSPESDVLLTLIETIESCAARLTGVPEADLPFVMSILKECLGAHGKSALQTVNRGKTKGGQQRIYQKLFDLYEKSGSYCGATELGESLMVQERVMQAETHTGGLTLMTMHKSKGKEYDGVILAEGYSNDQRLYYGSKDDSALLLHVAISRARSGVRIIRQAAPLPGS